ncbi:ferrochelatase [Celerinatantimonas yamalensis]|uniref:Ferrochelatase n=1 Tax=Celerinatantimonas yamalensis TaxID=559956 RepID=A0ABW9G2E7_9GAMM
MTKSSTTVILANLGTPSQPTAKGVRDFLNRFLSDQRVVSLSPWVWQPILKGIVLPLRSPRVAKLYQQIWLEGGSPLQVYSENLCHKISSLIGDKAAVRLAMSYSEPFIEDVIDTALKQGCERLIVLPMYPQYSVSTTAPVFDACTRAMKGRFALPSLQFVRQYYDWPGYCELLAQRIRQKGHSYDETHQLVFSFHGIPVRYANLGDPYPQQCEATAKRIAELLELPQSAWKLSFQSRFGKEPWLQPYTDEMLKELAQQGVKAIDIISPAFSVDCLETLEEISSELKDVFLDNGGEHFQYIEALNDGDDHAQILSEMILEQLN